MGIPVQFNPDKNKQAIQVIFSHRKSKPIHPPLTFNGSEVVTLNEHKHLGFFLDSALSFLRHTKEIIINSRRGVGIIRFMSEYVSRNILDQMYKLYVRPHLDYGDLIYHKDDPEVSLSLTKRLESVQYTAALAVTGAWKGTNKSKLLDELGWEYLHDRRRYRRLTHFFKLLKGDAPEYMTAPIPQPKLSNYSLREQNVFEPLATRTQGYYDSYYPYCLREWNKLDPSLRSIDSLSKFKLNL